MCLVWYDSYLSITAAEKGGEILLLTRTLIALLVTGIWISSTYQVVMQMNNEYYYAQQSSEQQNSYWWNDPYNSSDGERKLIRLQRAYNRLVDRYEMAKFEEMSNFVHTNAFMVCYLFSLVSGLSGKRGSKRDEMATSISFFEDLSQTGNFCLHFHFPTFSKVGFYLPSGSTTE